MSPSGKTIFAFGCYLLVLGATLLLAPNLLLALFGFPLTEEVWIRIVGLLVIYLGIYYSLAGRRDMLPGNVVLCFQPAEERPPGGAIRMIEDAVMDDPKVDAVFGLHLSSSPVGTVGMRGGASQAPRRR